MRRYQMHVELARGIQQESDRSYANDTISGANALSLTTAGTHSSGTIAGTIMAPGDKDYFNLGTVCDRRDNLLQPPLAAEQYARAGRGDS